MDISIIICSTHPKTDRELVANIDDTIGVTYEIVHIDNSAGEYGICAAYNKGVERAKGDILCFMHEDVEFHSEGWGQRVVEYMSQPEVGAIGLAGSVFVPAESDWRFVGIKFHTLRVIQGFYSPSGQYCTTGCGWEPTGNLHQVAALDGVWFCIRRETFQKIRFDDVTFPHFHLYDSDISMQVNTLGLKLCVCDDIILEHFSEGTFTESFNEGLDHFLKKWGSLLPMVRGCETEISEAEMRKETEQALSGYKDRLAHDCMLLSCKKALKEGDLKSLSKEKRKFIYRQEYVFVKKAIKSSAPFFDAWRALHNYPWKKPKLKWKLIYKMFYYRILH